MDNVFQKGLRAKPWTYWQVECDEDGQSHLFMSTQRQEISSKILDLTRYVDKRREALKMVKILPAFNNLMNYGTTINHNYGTTINQQTINHQHYILNTLQHNSRTDKRKT